MRLLIVVSVSLLLMSCSESQQAGSSNSTANLTSGNSDLSSSAVSNTNSNLVSSSAVEAASDIQEIIKHEIPPKVVIDYKPKYASNDPNAPIEVAVLVSMEGAPLLIPLLSVPMNSEQVSVRRDEPDLDANLDVEEKFEAIDQQELNPATDSEEELAAAEKIVKEEKVRMRHMLVVAEYYRMSSIPHTWVDSEGSRYIPVDGAYLRDDVVGGAVGFSLKGAEHKPSGRLVLNRREGFLAQRVVPDGEWRKWPAFTQELSGWGKRQLDACQGKAGCKEAIDWLLAAEHITGAAYEYRLTNGGKLMYVNGNSKATKAVLSCRSDCPYVDEMQFHLWIYVATDGAEQVLHSGDWFYTDMDSVHLVNHYCDSQCLAGWTGQPWIISSKGQTFIVGPFSGGTLSGYMIYEVMPSKLGIVGRDAWGS